VEDLNWLAKIGEFFASSTRTLYPACATRQAKKQPAVPPPTTITSALNLVGI